MGVVVAIDSATAISKIAISNGHCIDRVFPKWYYSLHPNTFALYSWSSLLN